MSVIGLDFGSHACAIALWYEEKDVIEVIADDLGSRTIPSYVGFRSGEIITGQSAMSQYHKNHNNTFEDIRAMILNPDITTVNVPILEKELPVQEVVSHYFRNIHNQIKQQVGKAVRECVISLPGSQLDEPMRLRLYEAAQAGGIRIKSIISDTTSTLLANGFDSTTITSAGKVLVVDMGWSKSVAHVYSVSGGLFFPQSDAVTNTSVSGKVLVNLLADHCAKDFQRKSKQSCTDSSKAMLRLRRECEETMKHLSTGQESTIDIDSLYEGIDFSTKISRAKFEDLATIPFIQLKALITNALESAKLTPETITHVCLTGGLSAMPKVLSTIKTLFPHAIHPRGRFEMSETQCIGAAVHGKLLLQQNLLDNPPTKSPPAVGLNRPILISPTSKSSDGVIVLPSKTVLPIIKKIPATLNQSNGYFQILAGDETEGGVPTVLGEVVFAVEGATASTPITVSIYITIELDSSLKIEVKNQTDDKLLVTLNIPKP